MTTTTEKINTSAVSEAIVKRPAISPRFTVAENKDAFVVTAYVPGVAPDAIETTVDGEKLVVNARRTWTAPQGWSAVHRETATADYRLALALDRRVNRDGIEARLMQGVLTLTLPKAEEIKPRKIEIAG